MRKHDAISVSRRDILLSAIGFLGAAKRLPGWQDTTFSTDVKVVNVLATVRNKQGQIVQNLTKDDFTLEEDGRPQTIRYFSRETDLPLTLGLLIDTSMSQRRVLGQERTASYRSWTRCCAKTRTWPSSFISTGRWSCSKTSRPRARSWSQRDVVGNAAAAAARWRRRISPGSGGPASRRAAWRRTMLYDAVLLASDEIMKKQHGPQSRHHTFRRCGYRQQSEFDVRHRIGTESGHTGVFHLVRRRAGVWTTRRGFWGRRHGPPRWWVSAAFEVPAKPS